MRATLDALGRQAEAGCRSDLHHRPAAEARLFRPGRNGGGRRWLRAQGRVGPAAGDAVAQGV